MTVLEGIIAEARDDLSLHLVAGFVLTQVAVRTLARAEHARLRALPFFVGMHALLVPVAGVLRAYGSTAYRDVRLPALLFGALAAVSATGSVLFLVLLPRTRLRTPRILSDVLVALASILAVFAVATRLGFNLSGLIATSAVLTAVIGFSLQDALGNVMGGLALQLDSSLSVGDWIRVGEVTGRVTEIRWRYTAVETRNWETVLIPNSLIIKNQVLVLGRRAEQPLQLRRWVYFNVDFRHPPPEVIQVVTDALRTTKIPNVAQDPSPNCILSDFSESYGRYAVRYWLTDLAVDDPTDSAVRTCVFFALKRAGMSLSIPAHALFVTEESADRETKKSARELERRARALARVELFAKLDEESRQRLARGLRDAPFARGETITRQGSEAHWLYLVTKGQVSVRVTAEGGLEREVARLGEGNFFGEMSLMTGAPRSATVIALTDVECYRLDKNAFKEVIRQRPELAEHVAGLLAKRQVELVAVKEGLDQEARSLQEAAHRDDLVAKIRDFFGLDDDDDGERRP